VPRNLCILCPVYISVVVDEKAVPAKFYLRPFPCPLITVPRYALHGLCDRNSARPSVRLSVTLVDCVHMVRPAITISSPNGSPMILVSGDITFIPKFEGVKKQCIAVNGTPISQLRDVTCHMGSHSFTCHPTQVNTPRLNPSQ